MLEPLDDALLPENEAELTAEITELERRQTQCDAHIKALLEQEDPASGLFLAAEIHAAKQLKTMLAYQHAVRVAKRNRGC